MDGLKPVPSKDGPALQRYACGRIQADSSTRCASLRMTDLYLFMRFKYPYVDDTPSPTKVGLVRVSLSRLKQGLNRRFLHFGYAFGRNDGFVEDTKQKPSMHCIA